MLAPGTKSGMDFLFKAELSDLMSDEGPLFGHQGIGPWDDVGEECERGCSGQTDITNNSRNAVSGKNSVVKPTSTPFSLMT